MARYILSVPPEYYQTGFYCWAAGSASWLKAMKMGVATPNDLVIRFGQHLDDEGALIEKKMPTVFRELGLSLYRNYSQDVNYSFLRYYLEKKGHILLMFSTAGSDVGHTYVVYGVGYPSDAYFNVFNPLKGEGGYQHVPFTWLRRNTDRVYLAWSAAAK
jgi:hypothetical protein